METTLIISSIFLWAVVLFNLLLTVGLVRQQNTAAHRVELADALPIGQSAPDFTAYTLEEQTVTLSDYAGQEVAFIFFSVQCKPCQELLPQLEGLYPFMRNADVKLVLVSQSPLKHTRTYVEQHHISIPVLADSHEGRSIFDTYNVKRTPSYYLIGKDGSILSAGLPGLPGGEWAKMAQRWKKLEAPLKSGRR